MTVEILSSPPVAAAPPARPILRSIGRGLAGKCPHCGQGRVFSGYLKVVDHCEACGEDLSHQRADDLPPYLTIMVVGHIVVPLLLWTERAFKPDLWLQLGCWLPATLLLTLLLIQPIKGGVVGLQWANRMHGFGGPDPDQPDVSYLAPERLSDGR